MSNKPRTFWLWMARYHERCADGATTDLTKCTCNVQRHRAVARLWNQWDWMWVLTATQKEYLPLEKRLRERDPAGLADLTLLYEAYLAETGHKDERNR